MVLLVTAPPWLQVSHLANFETPIPGAHHTPSKSGFPGEGTGTCILQGFPGVSNVPPGLRTLPLETGHPQEGPAPSSFLLRAEMGLHACMTQARLLSIDQAPSLHKYDRVQVFELTFLSPFALLSFYPQLSGRSPSS